MIDKVFYAPMAIISYIPLLFSAVFTLFDLFVAKVVTSQFITNPSLVILSFLELYLISAVTTLYIEKQYWLKKK